MLTWPFVKLCVSWALLIYIYWPIKFYTYYLQLPFLQGREELICKSISPLWSRAFVNLAESLIVKPLYNRGLGSVDGVE